MLHVVEVDQSGKIEDTKEDAVLALSNGMQLRNTGQISVSIFHVVGSIVPNTLVRASKNLPPHPTPSLSERKNVTPHTKFKLLDVEDIIAM